LFRNFESFLTRSSINTQCY